MASSSSSSALELLHALRGEFATGGGGGGSSCLFHPLGGTITEPHRRPSGLQMTARRRPIQSALPTVGADALALRSKMARHPVKRWEPILQPRSQPIISTEEIGERRRRTREPISAEMLDKWTRDSVGEIVRNTRGGSPFFVHIFSDSKGESLRLRLEMEAALPDSWPRIKKRWEREENCRPDAVILVEELGVANGDQQDCCCCCSESKLAQADEGEKAAASAAKQLPTSRAISKTWGLLVQGRGTNCAACYILNTNRVRSSVGSCTHFCLTRGRLGEPLDVQLKRSWLHQS